MSNSTSSLGDSSSMRADTSDDRFASRLRQQHESAHHDRSSTIGFFNGLGLVFRKSLFRRKPRFVSEKFAVVRSVHVGEKVGEALRVQFGESGTFLCFGGEGVADDA